MMNSCDKIGGDLLDERDNLFLNPILIHSDLAQQNKVENDNQPIQTCTISLPIQTVKQ